MFSEISIYQVKPSEVDTFEAIMQEATEAMKVMEGAMFFRLMKRTHYIDGETWADITKFETKEDAEAFARCGTPNAFAQKFYSFINLNSCRSHLYTIEKTFK